MTSTPKLGFLALFGQGFGALAPPYNCILIGAVVAGFAAGATPAVFLLAGTGITFYALMIIYLARHVRSSGGLYNAVQQGLGQRGALWYAAALLANGFFSIPATVISASNLMQLMLASAFPRIPWLSNNWLPWAVLLLCGAVVVTCRGAELSGRVIVGILAAGMTAIAGLDFSILYHIGWANIPWGALFIPAIGRGDHALLMGTGIAFITFAGSEGAVFLSEEAKNPRRDIPLSVILSILFSLVFYVLTALAFVAALPGEAIARVWADGGAMVIRTLCSVYIGAWYGYVTLALIALAAIAGVISFINYIARLILALARDGYLPAALGAVNRSQSPHNAIALLAAGCGATFAGGVAMAGFGEDASLLLYSWLYVSVSLFLLAGYLIVCCATWRLASRAGDPFRYRVVVPLVTFMLMLLAAVAQFTPPPPRPFDYAVWTALAILLVAFLSVEGLLKRRVQAGARFVHPAPPPG
jgi:amino acid transporter